MALRTARTTEEWANKPDAQIRIVCETCKQLYEIEDFLKQEELAEPYEDYFRIYWLCPNCGHKRHAYYESQELRSLQIKLATMLSDWNHSHESADFDAYLLAQQGYQKEFNKVQQDLSVILGKDLQT